MFSLHLRTVFVWSAFLALAHPASLAWAQSRSAQKARDRVIREIEHVLRVPGDGVGFTTWYVLAFFDQAKRITEELKHSTATHRHYNITREVSGVKRVMLVHGRRQAAEAVLQYMLSANMALESMSPTNSPNRCACGKLWDYRAFYSETDARGLYAVLVAQMPSSASSR